MQFSEEALNSFADGLHAVGGVNFPNSTVKARITFYKTLYYTVEDMIGTGGLAWDLDECSVYGSNLQWTSYITVNPLGEWIRGNKIPWYEELVQVMKHSRLDV
ncbi:hypothetical protein Taro_056313 [Colocasia esculenta]|uniref:Myb/SANT-like domain-containing protein n=1 Tax=Colocasia esculenta TaxID=4460 RepID=A0A843XTK0_COLES|nr:hypothetical protein [Colocasia esculenta]